MSDSLLPGFTMTGDSTGRWPVVMTSPHSGRDFPPAFLAASRLTAAQLRRAEDPFVDMLLDAITDVPVLRARFGRAFVDLNRDADELDAGMIDGTPPLPPRQTERVAAGLGVLPRVAAHGLDIYRRRITAADVTERLATLHRPWHARISALLARAQARHGYAILIDCHSMPRPAGIVPPQIILGDRHGTSAAPALVGLIERHFATAGWRVGRNTPYAGGHTTVFHGNPAAGIHAIQIEIDRSLYMEPQRMQRHDGFDAVAAAMAELARLVLGAAPHLGLGPPMRDAAE